MEKVYCEPQGLAAVRSPRLLSIGRDKWLLIYGSGYDDDNGAFEWRQRFVGAKPTLEQIKAIVYAQIDANTDAEIKHGMTCYDMPVCLDMELQTNIIGVLVSIDSVVWPLTFKLGEQSDGAPAFFSFESAAQFREFAQAAKQHKQECYARGWDEKAEIDWSI